MAGVLSAESYATDSSSQGQVSRKTNQQSIHKTINFASLLTINYLHVGCVMFHRLWNYLVCVVLIILSIQWPDNYMYDRPCSDSEELCQRASQPWHNLP